MMDNLMRTASTWNLPPTCTCPDDCDCGGILICRVCWGRNEPHRDGQEDHADLDDSLAAKRTLGWDQETYTEWGFTHRDGSISATPDEETARRFASGLGYSVTGEVVRRVVSPWQPDAHA